MSHLGMICLLLVNMGKSCLCVEEAFPWGLFCRETLGIFTPVYLLWQLLWAESQLVREVVPGPWAYCPLPPTIPPTKTQMNTWSSFSSQPWVHREALPASPRACFPLLSSLSSLILQCDTLYYLLKFLASGLWAAGGQGQGTPVLFIATWSRQASPANRKSFQACQEAHMVRRFPWFPGGTWQGWGCQKAKRSLGVSTSPLPTLQDDFSSLTFPFSAEDLKWEASYTANTTLNCICAT